MRAYKPIALILFTLILAGCAGKEGNDLLRTRTYFTSVAPCISIPFPFDVTLEDIEEETVAGVHVTTRHLSSEQYAMRIAVMRLGKGFFRDKMLHEVYAGENILFSRGFTPDQQRSAIVLQQKTEGGCPFIRGRLEHRQDDRTLITIDFRPKTAKSASQTEETESMKKIINHVYDKLIISQCAEVRKDK